jgi:hypothetical protein
MKRSVVLLALCATLASSQSTSPMNGTVIDAQNAFVPQAEITVTNVATGQVLRTVIGNRGEWALSSVPPATCRVSVTKSGFRTQTVADVVVNAGVPAVLASERCESHHDDACLALELVDHGD